MMCRTIKTIFFVVFVSQVAIAQEEPVKQTLFGGKINKIGLIGSLSGQYTSLNGGFKPAGGASLSLLFNEKLAIGVAGYGIEDQTSTVGALRTNGGVGGLQIEYISKPSKLVHISFPLLIGMGIASRDSVSASGNRYGKGGGRGRNREFDWGWDDSNGTNATFAVIQPGVNVNVNLFKFVSLFAGANYRIALNSNSTVLTNAKLSGLGLQVGLRGGFNGFSLAKLKK